MKSSKFWVVAVTTRFYNTMCYGTPCMCCSSTEKDSLPSARLCGMARHFKTEPTETVALCFGYSKLFSGGSITFDGLHMHIELGHIEGTN
jgi:hypothetical protein